MKILITGANGSLGYHLVKKLKDNNELYLLDLNFNRLNHLKEKNNIHFLNTNILDKDQVLNLDFELDIIIHLAAKVHTKAKTEAEKEEFFQINTEATKYLYQLALKKEISHFIFISTISLYGKEFIEVKEHSSLDYEGNPYAESKYLAEKTGLDLYDNKALPLTILRLATLYGKYDRGNYKKLINFAYKGLLPMVGQGNNQKSIIYVKDAAALITKILNNKNTYGEIYNVSEANYKYSEILDTITEVFEQTVLKIKAPDILINLYKKLPFALPVFNKLETLSTTTTVDNSKMLKELDFKPAYSFKEGLEDAKEYYRQ